MDSQNMKLLLKKYWSGETTAEEERAIKKYRHMQPEAFAREEALYFEGLSDFSELSLGEDFAENFMAIVEEHSSGDENSNPGLQAKTHKNRFRNFVFRYRNIAAAVLLIITMSAFFYNYNETRKAQLAETQQAYEQAKEALALISSKLNKGLEVTYSLDKFSSTQEKIKTEN